MGSLSENEFGMFVAWHLLDTKAKLKSQFCTDPKHYFFLHLVDDLPAQTYKELKRKDA
jgi:hypothetical protein